MNLSITNICIIADVNFPTMTENCNSEKSLLENETIRNQVNSYIQEEVLFPTAAEEGSDIEILEENITQQTLKKKRKIKLKNDLHKMKKLNSSSQDEITDVCGLQVTIKSLLKNDEIRKQIAPFIEEVVIDCSESELEENNSTAPLVHKVNDGLTDEQILDKAKDIFAKNLIKVKRKSQSKKPKNIDNRPTANNKVKDNNKTKSLEKIHVLDLTNDVSDDDIILSERVKNKKFTKEAKSNSKKSINLSQPNQNSIILENNSDSLIVDQNIFVIDGLHQSHENIESKHVEIPDLPITESDDWYYLNIARAPKHSSIEDDILIIQNSLKAAEISNKVEVEEELLPTLSNMNEKEKSVNVSVRKSNKIETEKSANVAVLHTNKIESEKPVTVAVKRKKRRRRRRKPWTIYGNRNIKKNIESVSLQNSNKKGIDNKEQISVNNENKATNLKNENIVGSHINNEFEDRTSGLENGIIEINKNSTENLTFSHELIPIIKKETETMDNTCSEVLQHVHTSLAGIDSNNGTNLNNDVFKPMLKPYRIKEVTPDFYRDEEKVYKTYQKISARRNTRLMTIQNSLANSRRSPNKDKSFFKKRSRFTVQCSKCGKKYERHWNLKRHEKACKTESVQTEFQCPQCPFKTPWRYNYQAHVAAHLVDPKLVRSYECHMQVRCTVCPWVRDAYQRGNKCVKCHSYYEYLCRMCGKDYTTYSYLKLHVLRNIQLGYGRTCHKCGRGGYPSLCSLKKHVYECGSKDDQNKSKVICNKIPYVRLVRHEEEPKESHPTNQMNVHCSNCDISSKTSERQAKCETCHADVSYKCELCKQFLPSYADLQSHVLNVHIMDSEMCLDSKNEESENIEEKNGCDEINNSCESNAQDDNVEQSLDKGVADDCNSPSKQKSEILTGKGVQRLDNFDNFVENINEENIVFQRFEANVDDITDESNDGMDTFSVPKCSEDATLSNIANSNIIKDKTCDSHMNKKYIEDREDVQLTSYKRQYKTNGIKRYCLRCDKTKKDLDVIRIGPKKEICEKCRSELLYQCVKCKRKSNIYSVMLYHWKHYCAFLHSKVKLSAPEKFKSGNRMQRHQCRLCAYSSNLKNRLMLHLQMHSWKDIKSAVLKPENHSDTLISSK